MHEPGLPELVAKDVIDARRTVRRVLTLQDLLSDPTFAAPEFQRLRATAGMMAAAMGGRLDLPVAIEVPGLGAGHRLGAGLRVASGKAAGRQLYATAFAGDIFFCDGRGEANLLRFTDVLPGDEVHVDNRRFLAFCYFARHHLMDEPQFDSLRLDGRAIHPQHPVPLMSPLMGVAYSGQFAGKLLWVHHTHDASLWPPQGVVYERAVHRSQGAEGATKRFRLRWTENAEHLPPLLISASPGRSANTWLIDYLPVIEQSLLDLVCWVERGIEPAPTAYTYRDGKVSLPSTAAERGGIQPVVAVTANGARRTEVRVGEEVTLEVRAAVPPGTGAIVGVQWDFDGSGSYPFAHRDVDGSATEVKRATTHAYESPGTYFATALVHSHRDGDVGATSRRIPNLAQVRIVVT